jgi:hypothetical protein
VKSLNHKALFIASFLPASMLAQLLTLCALAFVVFRIIGSVANFFGF